VGRIDGRMKRTEENRTEPDRLKPDADSQASGHGRGRWRGETTGEGGSSEEIHGSTGSMGLAELRGVYTPAVVVA